MSSTIILESSWDTANCCNQVVDQVLDFVASDLAERFFPKFWVQVLTENALVAIVPRQNSTRRELILESIDFQRAGLKLQIDVTMLHGRVAGLLRFEPGAAGQVLQDLPHQRGEGVETFYQRLVSQIFPVEPQQIKSNETGFAPVKQ